jgi:prepilin-type N-terminal cleavage/methylation domain-containing protein
MSNFKYHPFDQLRPSALRLRLEELTLSVSKSQISHDQFPIRNCKLEIGNCKFSAGFTLVELLLAVTIIGILMTIASVNFISVRERARDAQRKSDLSQIQIAMELLKSDIGRYPIFLPACEAALDNGGGTVFLKKMPCDPLSNEPYQFTNTGSGYVLAACIENKNDVDKRVVDSPGCASGKAFQVNDP